MSTGGLVLMGWLLDIPALKSVWTGPEPMKANAALAFVFAGGSLWMLGADPADVHWSCHRPVGTPSRLVQRSAIGDGHLYA